VKSQKKNKRKSAETQVSIQPSSSQTEEPRPLEYLVSDQKYRMLQQKHYDRLNEKPEPWKVPGRKAIREELAQTIQDLWLQGMAWKDIITRLPESMNVDACKKLRSRYYPDTTRPKK
jgi:hypothetical protein